MNKLVKGAAAGATGVVLLMGGFGTFAVWQNSSTLDAGKISSGALTIDSVGAPTWKDSGGNTWAATDLMVPGDSVTETVPLAVTATGKNLKAELSMTGLDNKFGALSITLSYAGKSTTVTGNGPVALDYSGATDVAALDGATQATLTFSLADTVTGDQSKTADLSAVTVHLDQLTS